MASGTKKATATGRNAPAAKAKTAAPKGGKKK